MSAQLSDRTHGRNDVISIRPAGGMVGAHVDDIDLSRHLDDDVVGRLRSALFEHGVLLFKDQKLSPEQHIAFAERFGPIDINQFFAHAPGYPQIAEVRKDPGQKANIGGSWHTDHSFDEKPALGSILYAIDVPPVGGDTLFANMYAAFEALSDGLKQTLETLEAVHSNKHVYGADAAIFSTDLKGRVSSGVTGEVVHPVVIRHPGSGRKALYVNAAFTVQFVGWTAAESRPLLEYLYRHASQPEFCYRQSWQKGSLAFWDNRATWHYAVNDYQGEARLLHRITVEGERLSGVH
jgi:taurine dioxygenase